MQIQRNVHFETEGQSNQAINSSFFEFDKCDRINQGFLSEYEHKLN